MKKPILLKELCTCGAPLCKPRQGHIPYCSESIERYRVLYGCYPETLIELEPEGRATV